MYLSILLSVYQFHRRNQLIAPNKYHMRFLITHCILIDLGCIVYVQTSIKRIYTDKEYTEVGAFVTKQPWYHLDFIKFLILGLKELDNFDKLLFHTHIYFSHTYLNQLGSELILSSFKKTSSILYDLEFFTDFNSKRLTTFGYWAGVVGCALALIQYSILLAAELLNV